MGGQWRFLAQSKSCSTPPSSTRRRHIQLKKVQIVNGHSLRDVSVLRLLNLFCLALPGPAKSIVLTYSFTSSRWIFDSFQLPYITYLEVEDPAVEGLVVRVAEDGADAGGALRRPAPRLPALAAARRARPRRPRPVLAPGGAVGVRPPAVLAVRGPVGGKGRQDRLVAAANAAVLHADLAAVSLLPQHLPLQGTVCQHGAVGPLADDLQRLGVAPAGGARVHGAGRTT